MSKLVRTVTLEAGDVARGILGNVTKREALAFKAGGWASLPIDYALEKYALPFVKKNFSEKGFYGHISQFGKSGGKKIATAQIKETRKRKMSTKRKYSKNDYVIQKRLRRVEAMAKSEMKTITWTSSGTVTQGTQNLLDLTSMAQGVAVNERVGDQIKVWRIEIRGYAIAQLDHYVIQKHGSTNPVYADFGTGAYAFLDDGVNNSRYTEWLSFRNLVITPGSNASYREVLQFPKGIIVKYDETVNAPVQNGLVFVSRNTTATDYAQNFSIRLWYTDK